jgi:peroxiredoxin
VSLDIGDPAPAFELPDTDGAVHRLDGGPATVVVFTCNHCPYALAWHDRLLDVARDYEARGVRLLAINPNDAVRYPAGLLRGDAGARAPRRRLAAPYLHDATQEVAAAYGARTTPDVFVVDADGRVAYRGAPDADYDDPGQGAAWLREALDAVLEGRRPGRARTEPVGCSIKWRA